MSINTISVDTSGRSCSQGSFCFEIYQGEFMKFHSETSRQTLTIKSKENPSRKTHISAADGRIYVTNKRFIFLTDSQGDFFSFQIDLNRASLIQFSHQLNAPWFGANYWQFVFFSSRADKSLTDGLPPNEWFTGEIRFKDGGLFEFVDIINDTLLNTSIDDELPRYEG